MDTRIPLEIMPNSGVTAGSYGPSADATPGYGVTFDVPYMTVDAKGRVTEAFTRKIKIPASDNTDTKVTQTVTTTSAEYPLLAKNTTATANITDTARFAAGVTVNPSTKTITATKFKGDLEGNADSATEFAAAESVALTGDVTGSASSKAGWSVATTLSNSGVTADTYGSTTQQTPAHGATFDVPYVTVDAKGRVTAAGTSTVKLPSDQNTDTKVTQTVSTDNAELPLLAKDSNGTATITASSKFAAAVKLNPSTGTVTATKFSGPLAGNASSATEFSAAKSVTLTGDVTGTASSKAGWSVATTLANSGVTAGTYSTVTVDAKGRVTAGNVVHTYTTAASAAKNWYRIANASTSQTDASAPLHTQFLVTAYNTAQNADYYEQWFVNIAIFGRQASVQVFGGSSVPFSQIRVLYENTLADVSSDDRPAIDLYLNYVVDSACTVKITEVYNSGWTFLADGVLDASTVPTGFENRAVSPYASGVQYCSNSDTSTKLKTARYIDGVSFNGSADIVHYGTCSIASATAAKTVACTGYALKTGGRILVKFTNTNTAANATLNVNSTGAKAIYVNGAAVEANRLQGGTIYL